MQVLVALFRAGAIVTREELTQRCWDGRVVGDDSINRVLSRIRHIAADFGQGSFSVETITKVGYRLNVAGAGSSEFAVIAKPTEGSRRKMMGSFVAAGVGAATRTFSDLPGDDDIESQTDLMIPCGGGIKWFSKSNSWGIRTEIRDNMVLETDVFDPEEGDEDTAAAHHVELSVGISVFFGS